MNQREMAAWWEVVLKNQSWSAKFKESLEELTGRNPVLLHAANVVINEYVPASNSDIEPADHESELLANICRCDAWEDATARIQKYAWDYIASRGELEQKRLVNRHQKQFHCLEVAQTTP